MNTEVSTRRRAQRQESSGRQAAPDTVRPPARLPGAGRPGARPAGTRQAGRSQPGVRDQATGRPAGRGLPDARPGGARFQAARHVPRTRFILLVLGMLGGGLVCLLVINTTLATASFRIDALQRGNAALTLREQTLQQQVATEESPSWLERRALKLGMRTQPLLNVLNLRTGRVYRQPADMPGIPNVPGYAP